METFTYYPGCTLRTKAKDLDTYARVSAEALGISLVEPENWQCCGGAYTTATNEVATKLSAVRTLIAGKETEGLVTVCSACHNVIKQTNYDISHNEAMAAKVQRYLGLDEAYTGDTKVYHYLELLRDVVGFDKLKEKVVNPFKGKKIAAYYGCLLLRPSKALAMDNPENPVIMEVNKMKWTSLNDLREKYLSFFESKEHLRLRPRTRLPSGRLWSSSRSRVRWCTDLPLMRREP